MGVMVSVILAAAAGTLAARWSVRHAQPAPPPPPEQAALTVDPQHLDFGEVWETDRFEWPLIVVNQGATPATVTDVNGSCTCLTVSPREFNLLPGQKQQLQIVLKLRSRTSQAEEHPQEEFAASVWTTVRGQEKPTYWQLRGRIRRSVSTVERVDLGSVSQRSPETAKQQFPVRLLSESIQSLEVKPSSPALRTELVRGVGGAFQVAVVPAAGLPKGKHESAVILAPVSKNGERLPPVTVPVTFDVGDDVQATPQLVQFGGREVGQNAREVASLRSVRGAPFRVEGVRTEGDGLSLRHLEQGELSVYEVIWRVGKDGSFEGRAIFQIATTDGESFEVIVPVRGFGYQNK